MGLDLERITYKQLNAKQRETYNFQKVAAVLADYGFNCIKLDDDWLGADFLAFHKDGKQTLKVQLKGGLVIDKKYTGKDIYLCFRIQNKGPWYLIPHDELVNEAGRLTPWLTTNSWRNRGRYFASQPSKRFVSAIAAYVLTEAS